MLNASRLILAEALLKAGFVQAEKQEEIAKILVAIHNWASIHRTGVYLHSTSQEQLQN